MIHVLIVDKQQQIILSLSTSLVHTNKYMHIYTVVIGPVVWIRKATVMYIVYIYSGGKRERALESKSEELPRRDRREETPPWRNIVSLSLSILSNAACMAALRGL